MNGYSHKPPLINGLCLRLCYRVENPSELGDIGRIMANLPASLKRAREAERANRRDFTTAFGQLKIAEQTFVMAYLENSDDPRHAIRKAYPGIQSNVENVRVLDMMRRPLVIAAIAEKQNERLQRFEITAENIIREVALVAFARMGDFAKVNEDGTMSLDLTGIPEDELSERLAAVSEVTFDDTLDDEGKVVGRKTKFKLHPKNDGLDKLMKHFGLYAAEKREISGPGGAPIPIAAVTVQMTPEEARREYERMLDD